MSLLPQTPYSVIHQLSMMAVQWHNSLLEEILWSLMETNLMILFETGDFESHTGTQGG